MTNKNLKKLILQVFVLLCSLAGFAQTIPRSVEVNAYHSLASDQILEMKAYESICIQEGFRMEKGSSLRLVVVPRENQSRPADKVLVVYPNPSSGEITVQGTFLNDDLVIYDRKGNLVMQLPITGENPVLDISSLKGDQYFVKTSKSEIPKRIIKN